MSLWLYFKTEAIFINCSLKGRTMKGKIELLAPAGNIEALHAAVENGADAVYLGGKLFNARMQAGNFDDNQLSPIQT
jgi:hypothetical protein